MANEQPNDVFNDTRAFAQSIHDAIYKVIQCRDRFNANGGTAGFQGSGKLFAADGSGQEIPFADFLGVFNALGALEADTEWPAFLAVLARARAN